MSSILKKRASLKRLFTNKKWTQDHLSKTALGRKIEGCILDNNFWDHVAYMVSFYEPLYVVLCIFDIEVVSTIPILYDATKKMKDKIQQPKGKKWVVNYKLNFINA